MRGNAAIFKCQIPSFVADHVDLTEWVSTENDTYKIGENFGVTLRHYQIRSNLPSSVCSFIYAWFVFAVIKWTSQLFRFPITDISTQSYFQLCLTRTRSTLWTSMCWKEIQLFWNVTFRLLFRILLSLTRGLMRRRVKNIVTRWGENWVDFEIIKLNWFVVNIVCHKLSIFFWFYYFNPILKIPFRLIFYSISLTACLYPKHPSSPRN